MMGMSDQNAVRQIPSSAKIPPSAGPSSVAMPHMPEIIAIARGQSGSGKTMRVMA